MAEKIVREFHHTLLWPVQLRPLKRDASAGVVHYWETLKRNPGPWTYVEDPLLINDETCMIGYEEFVYFLPYVQRFLYGVGDEGTGRQSSLHVFHRHDIKQAQIQLREGETEIALDVLRTRLYFSTISMWHYWCWKWRVTIWRLRMRWKSWTVSAGHILRCGMRPCMARTARSTSRFLAKMA